MGLGAVDPDGNVSGGGAELLIEASVRADPQVILTDLHLGRETAVNQIISR